MKGASFGILCPLLPLFSCYGCQALPSLSLSGVYLSFPKLGNFKGISSLKLMLRDACDQLPWRIPTLFYPLLSVIAARSLPRTTHVGVTDMGWCDRWCDLVPPNVSDRAETQMLFASKLHAEKTAHGEIQPMMLHRPQIKIVCKAS
jgi:hypothetical protein